MDNTKEILKARFSRLPKDVQDAILSVDFRPKMEVIAKKNNLHIDQTGILENEAVFVMTGLAHPNDLIANLEKNLEVSEEKAEAIAEDLNNEIFLNVRKSLEKVIEERGREAEEREKGGSFLVGSLLVEKGKEGDIQTIKKETDKEENLNREDILRDIEDKEHRNLPSAIKSELHLETRHPNEIIQKDAKPSYIKDSYQDGAQSVKINIKEMPLTNSNSFSSQQQARSEKHFEAVNFQSKIPDKPSKPPEMIKTMKGDIFKEKMSGAVGVPKDKVEISVPTPPIKDKQSEIGGKFDPYREEIE